MPGTQQPEARSLGHPKRGGKRRVRGEMVVIGVHRYQITGVRASCHFESDWISWRVGKYFFSIRKGLRNVIRIRLSFSSHAIF